MVVHAEAKAAWLAACAFVQGAVASSAGGLVPGAAVSLAQALDSPSATLRLSVRPLQHACCPPCGGAQRVHKQAGSACSSLLRRWAVQQACQLACIPWASAVGPRLGAPARQVRRWAC